MTFDEAEFGDLRDQVVEIMTQRGDAGDLISNLARAAAYVEPSFLYKPAKAVADWAPWTCPGGEEAYKASLRQYDEKNWVDGCTEIQQYREKAGGFATPEVKKVLSERPSIDVWGHLVVKPCAPLTAAFNRKLLSGAGAGLPCERVAHRRHVRPSARADRPGLTCHAVVDAARRRGAAAAEPQRMARRARRSGCTSCTATSSPSSATG